jgi:hypothetical protein
VTPKALLLLPLAAVALAACGSSASSSVEAAARGLRGTEVHFCFVTQAVAGGDTTQLTGCGDQNAATRVARTSLDTTIDLMGQTQTESLVVERIASHEWVRYKGTWYVSTSAFPPASPGAIASLLSLGVATRKVAGIKVLGQPTTGYSETITGMELAAHRGQLTRSMLSSLQGLRTDRLLVYLNDAGEVVQVDQDQQLESSGTLVSVTSTVLFSRFGERVAFTAPPKDEISSRQL